MNRNPLFGIGLSVELSVLKLAYVLAFTRYYRYQYCMFEHKSGGGGGKPYIAQS